MVKLTTLLQITRRHLRLIQGQWPQVTMSCQMARSPGSDFRHDIQQLLKQCKRRVSEVVLVIPRSDIILKHLVLPSQDDREVRKMLEVQIPLLTPFERDKSVFDCVISPGLTGGFADVLCGIAMQERVQSYIKDLENAGMSVREILFSGEGLYHFIQQALPENASRDEYTGVLCVDAFSSELVVCRGRRLCLTYDIPYGLEDSGEHADGLSNEIARCMKVFSHEIKGQKIASLTVLGSAQDGLAARLGKYEGLNITITDFKETLPDAAAGSLKGFESGHDWISLMGLLMEGNTRPMLSFVPQAVHSRKQRKQRLKEITGFVLALGVAVFLSLIFFFILRSRQEAYLDGLQQEIARLQPDIEQRKQKKRFFETIDQSGISTVRAVREMYALFPEGAFLESFVMRNAKEFTLQGSAIDSDAVNILQRALLASEYFQNVELEYATKRRRFNEEMTEFKINFQLRGERL